MVTIEKNQSLDLKNTAITFMFAYAEQDIEKMMRLCDTEGLFGSNRLAMTDAALSAV